jgi:electron transport complex protein RnfD
MFEGRVSPRQPEADDRPAACPHPVSATIRGITGRDAFSRRRKNGLLPTHLHHYFNGTSIVPLNSPSVPIVIPSIYGLKGVGFETVTGDGPISYWNAYVGIGQMGGKGSFSDPRIGVTITETPDLVTPKLPALLEYQLSLQPPAPAAGSLDKHAADRGKQLFGGLGHNFVNPALAARAFMMASWPVQMTAWQKPGWDAVSSATPLAIIKNGSEVSGQQMPQLLDMFLGNIGGTIGETSALAILIGAAYLVMRKVITLELPVAFIGTVGFMTWMLGGKGMFTGDFVYHIFAGGLMLGAFFMATDYTTSPVTFKGRIIMGIGCGLLTSIIRLYGGYPEGVSYSILLMNLVVPMIDRFVIPKSFGGGAVKNA